MVNESHARILRRNALLLVLVFLHPLWLAVRPFGDELGLAGKVNHVVLPWIELAWLADLLITAWLIDWLRPFPDPWRPVKKPLQTPTHTGFEAKLDPMGSWSGRALAAVIGTLTSTAGMTLWILLATFLDREGYHGMFDHLPVWVYCVNIADKTQGRCPSAFFKLAFANEVELIGQGAVDHNAL